MHAWKYPDHEKAVARVCRKLGFSQVSASHEISPLIKLVGRGDTTVVDAYLSPILGRYVQRVAEELGIAAPFSGPPAISPSTGETRPAPRLMFMMSSGGLTAAEKFQGRDALLSGPAGGVVGMVVTAKLAVFE
jgi:5-oxoprolinase (ATP-hydrolysing)